MRRVIRLRREPDAFFAVLKKVQLKKFASLGDFDACLAHEVLPKVPLLEKLEPKQLDAARDELIGLIFRASSIAVTDPARFLENVAAAAGGRARTSNAASAQGGRRCGSLNETMAHPREVFRAAVIGAAFGVVLMHNHPSGDPSPSDADVRMTKRFAESGRILCIEVIDHIIVGSKRHLSLREAGIL